MSLDVKDTIQQPPLVAQDAVAAERGFTPIRVPSQSSAFVALRGPSGRKVVIASLLVAVLSLGTAIGAVVWARHEVAACTSADLAISR